MSKKQAALYARVSDPDTQDTDDKVSIDQQLAQMRALRERNNWQILAEFVDRKSYQATQNPKKGKTVNPSGERADRPQFLAMLDRIKTGEVDVVLCWRDDRLVRHPRVAVALEDAMDISDAKRNGKPKVEVRDATGAIIDRFTLSIKATIWREENKRRAERSKMGKLATLQQGRWPGGYRRHGYKTVKEPGKRGRIIVEDPQAAPIVRKIYEMYDAGDGVGKIRAYLIANRVPQIYTMLCKHDWSLPLISRILRRADYLGRATWRFSDGITETVDIPQIIDDDLWQRVQRRMDRNKTLSRRNAKGIYLLQGIIRCGDCGNGISVSKSRHFTGGYAYQCHTASHNAHEPHPHPYSHHGPNLDWAVWRHLVDYGIKRPDVISEEVQARQAELQAQGDSVDSDITHARRRLAEVAQERAFYQRQAARGKIREEEFDARMAETEETEQYWADELERLQELRDNTTKVQAGIDYATELLTTLQNQLPEIDQPPDELKTLPEDKRNEILKARQEIVRVLCDKVYVYADRRVRIEGVLDGSEAAQFDLRSS